MPNLAFTDAGLRSLQPPLKGQQDFWDSALPGFGIRVSQGGAKTFVVNIDKARRTIGRYPIVKLSEARTEAKRMFAERTLGKVRPQSVTYEQATKLFLEEKGERRRARTVSDHKRHLDKLGFKGQLADLSHPDLERKLKRLTASEFNHRLSCAKTFFRWAQRKRYRPDDPTIGLTPLPTKSRSRVLTDAELKRIWLACSVENELPTPFRTIVRLLILQGFRRTECASLRTSYVDGDTGTLPGEVVKNNIEFIFPLCATALDLLRAVEVSSNDAYFFPARGKPHKPFNGWSKSKKILDQLSGVTGWTLHDCRRTFRTRLGKLGVMPHIAERLVHHVTAQTEMERVYDMNKYLPEMRAALELWERHFHSMLA